MKKIRILKSRGGGALSKKDVFFMPKPNRPLEETKVSHLRYFVCKKETYLWDDFTKKFFQIRGLDEHIYCEQFYDQVGLSELEQIRKRLVYGLNDILVSILSIICNYCFIFSAVCLHYVCFLILGTQSFHWIFISNRSFESILYLPIGIRDLMDFRRILLLCCCHCHYVC